MLLFGIDAPRQSQIADKIGERIQRLRRELGQGAAAKQIAGRTQIQNGGMAFAGRKLLLRQHVVKAQPRGAERIRSQIVRAGQLRQLF